MSRPKSEKTLALEHDRAIRKERLERKRTEREAKRAARLKKQMTHESVVRNNGISKVQEGNQYFGLRDAIAVNEIMFCESCGHVVREKEMIGDICNICYHGKEVNDPEPELKAQGDSPSPRKGDGGNKPKGPVGQLTLLI